MPQVLPPLSEAAEVFCDMLVLFGNSDDEELRASKSMDYVADWCSI